MRISLKARVILTSLVVLVAAGVVTVWVSLPQIERWGVGFHQKSVTRSLAAWGVEDARITNDATAIHAAEMVGYIHSYYVPGPGYRGPLDVEAALERQRRDSIERIVASLERYTGLHHGTNVKRWTEWADERRGSAQPGPATRSQPVQPVTNSTPLSTGSGR
jgi:hypothetical protein